MKQLYYYILNDPDKPNRCKVGISTNLESRIRAYRTASPHAHFSKIYKLPHRRHEKRLIELFKDMFQVSSEVVYCNPRIVENIVDSYFDDNLIPIK